jgi:hypothetical protein
LGKVNSVEETKKKLEERDMNPGKGQTLKATSLLSSKNFSSMLGSIVG